MLFLIITTMMGSLYLTAVKNFTISIVNQPSPTNAMDCLSGYATFTARAEGSRQAMVASVPEQLNFCRARILNCRAIQVVMGPESVEMIASSLASNEAIISTDSG